VTIAAGHPLFDDAEPAADFAGSLRRFRWNGAATREDTTRIAIGGACDVAVPTFLNEFWTSRQRAAHSLHEISYRACFKPQLPRFFIERLTAPGDAVYDPFMGRGTTLLEAALLGRVPAGCDVNPLSAIVLAPRLEPPHLNEVAARLAAVDFASPAEAHADLLVFYHPDTLREICALRSYLLERERAGALDAVDRWIRMVAVNRLTGHSSGFFSVYTLPPNQAISVESQRKINAQRGQVPPRRSVPALILRKTRALLADCDPATRRMCEAAGRRAVVLTASARHTSELETGSIALVVTSPPFLDVVDYAGDNWLRCWFCGIDPQKVPLSIAGRVDEWQAMVSAVFRELARVVRPGGHVAFEVGEVRGGQVRLEEAVLPCGMAAGFEPIIVMINSQRFTKTSNVWGVTNNAKGTNTNRVVLFRRQP
jgi:hypothetical protein